MTPIRVLLADDHTLVRAGIQGLLQGLPGVEVVGEAGDGQEALRLSLDRIDHWQHLGAKLSDTVAGLVKQASGKPATDAAKAG